MDGKDPLHYALMYFSSSDSPKRTAILQHRSLHKSMTKVLFGNCALLRLKWHYIKKIAG